MKVKVDVISGFLGSGKTTFIQNAIKYFNEKGESVAVIENEFGKINIDGSLLLTANIKIYEITQGCLCCTLQGEFEKLILEICNTLKPDRILIEPSGIFMPGEIKKIFDLPEIRNVCTLNSINTLVDAVFFIKARERYKFLLENQLKHADNIIISKIESASEKVLDELIQVIEEISPGRRIFSRRFEDYSVNDYKDLFIDGIYTKRCLAPLDAVEKSGHGFAINSFGKECSRFFSEDELAKALERLVNLPGSTIVRGKGLVCGHDGMLLFNIVNGSFTIDALPGKRSSKVSFIGTDMDSDLLNDIFS